MYVYICTLTFKNQRIVFCVDLNRSGCIAFTLAWMHKVITVSPVVKILCVDDYQWKQGDAGMRELSQVSTESSYMNKSSTLPDRFV